MQSYRTWYHSCRAVGRPVRGWDRAVCARPRVRTRNRQWKAMRWLVVTGLSCTDSAAVTHLIALLTHFGTADFHARVNFFDAATTGTQLHAIAQQCPSVRWLQMSASATRHINAFTFVKGFKTFLWRSLSPQITSSYDVIWLKDSDVVTSPRLFNTAEVEHWMLRSNATVAQPSVLPLDNSVRSHGWWTPFRASFSGSCLVSTLPIVEQMTPIFMRPAFDTFRRRLLTIPTEYLDTDFGLETFWCGLRTPLLTMECST